MLRHLERGMEGDQREAWQTEADREQREQAVEKGA